MGRGSGGFTKPVTIEVFQEVHAEVKTLVVPEGGELPPEEELVALEAAEAEAAAAAAAEAETEHAEAEHAIAEVLEDAEEDLLEASADEAAAVADGPDTEAVAELDRVVDGDEGEEPVS